MTLGCCFLSDSRNILLQSRVISVHSWYLTSLINLSFFRLTSRSWDTSRCLFGSWCFVSLFDVSFFESLWSFRFHPSSRNFLFLHIVCILLIFFIRKGKHPWSALFAAYAFLLHVLSLFSVWFTFITWRTRAFTLSAFCVFSFLAAIRELPIGFFSL